MNITKDEKNKRVIGRLTKRQAAILLRMADTGYMDNVIEYFLWLVNYSEGGDECLCKYVSRGAGVHLDLLDVIRQASEYDLKEGVEISVSMEDYGSL